MKFPIRPAALAALLVAPLCADNGIPPDRMALTNGGSGTWNTDLNGMYGRSYFYQWSLDLVNWSYAPFIDFSGGLHRRGFMSSTPKFFLRNILTDDPTTDPELEDFANDGIGSLLKLKMGLDPFAPLAWVDADSDGIHDAIEQFWFGNLTSTGGSGSTTANGIRDVFAIQAGQDPTTDPTADPAQRTTFQYDNMGRLIAAGDTTYTFDVEGNLESSSN